MQGCPHEVRVTCQYVCWVCSLLGVALVWWATTCARLKASWYRSYKMICGWLLPVRLGSAWKSPHCETRPAFPWNLCDHLCQVWCLVEVAFQVKTVWHLHQAWGYLFTNKVETGCCLYWVEGHLARATRHGVCEPLKNLRKACIAIQDRLLVIVIAGGTAGRGSSWVSELGVSGNHQGRWMV